MILSAMEFIRCWFSKFMTQVCKSCLFNIIIIWYIFFYFLKYLDFKDRIFPFSYQFLLPLPFLLS